MTPGGLRWEAARELSRPSAPLSLGLKFWGPAPRFSRAPSLLGSGSPLWPDPRSSGTWLPAKPGPMLSEAQRPAFAGPQVLWGPAPRFRRTPSLWDLAPRFGQAPSYCGPAPRCRRATSLGGYEARLPALAGPHTSLMRPGAPLSPGLTEKTRHKPAWFTSGGEVSQRFFRASRGPAGRRSRAPSAGVPAARPRTGWHGAARPAGGRPRRPRAPSGAPAGGKVTWGSAAGRCAARRPGRRSAVSGPRW